MSRVVAGTSMVVIGSGGHARVVADVAEAAGARVVGFLDDFKAVGTAIGRWTVLGPTTWLKAQPQPAALGIGDNDVRRKVHGEARECGATFPAVVHPSAVVSTSAQLGAAAVVMPRAVINIDAEVGEGAIINTGAVIEHDCCVGDFAHVSPSATLAGAARVGAGAHVGAGAVLLPGVEVGEGCVVGAGAVVARPLPARSVARGVPARVTRMKP